MEGSLFVTQFIIYGGPGLIKVEAYDMEPVLMQDGSTAVQRGPSLRMVMPEESARALRDVLVRHLEKNAPDIPAARGGRGNGFAVYASAAKSFSPGTADQRVLISEVISDLDDLARKPFSSLRSPITDILSAIAGYRASFSTSLSGLAADPCLICKADIDRKISEIASVSPALSDQAREMLFALIGYTFLCEPVENRHLDYIAVVLRELMKRETGRNTPEGDAR